MKKVIITNKEEIQTHSANFETEEIVQEWLDNHIANNTFGKPDRWERETDGTHTEERTVTPEIGEEYTEYFFPCEYTYEITDITAEYEAEQARLARMKMGKRVRDLCDNILDLLAGYNLERALTQEQITQLETTFSSINQLLLNKRPFTAKTLIQSIVPDDILITEAMKNDILNEYVLAGLDSI